MKCVIGATNVKDFGRAIHSLAKIGEELYIEPGQSGVSFRIISSSRSAYFSYNFGNSFFTHYDGGLGGQTPAPGEDTLRCKVAMKAVYDKDSCPNHMVSEPRVLLDALSSFHQHTLEEISFCFTPHNLILKSHVEEPDPSKVVHTVVTLTRGEFEDYTIDSNCELTVCLKEIRALLTFTGSVGLSMKVYFSSPGSPIIFTFDSKPLYEGTLVLATLVQKPDIGNQSASKPCHKPQASTSSRLETSMNNNTLGDGEMCSRRNNLPDISNDDGAIQDITPAFDNSRAEVGCTSQRKLQHELADTPKTDTFNNEPVVFSSRSNHKTPQEEEEEDSDTVPSSPPAKKSRFFFRRCFEATFDPDTLPGHNVILAEDSDEEN